MHQGIGRGSRRLAFFAAVRRPLARGDLVASIAACALLVGCAGGRGGSIPYNVTTFGAPDAPSLAAVEEDYRISPLDVLKISVFQVPDLSGDFPVDLAGNVTLPLVGTIRAVNLTTAELDQQLTQKLGAKYLQHPDVSVAVKTSSTRTVTIEGAVRQAGVYPVGSRMTLIQVVALAHGTDESANPHRVAIFRRIQGQRMAAGFDLTRIRRGEAEDPQVFSGDIVVVDGSRVKSVFQTVLQSLPLIGLFRPLGL